MIVIGTSGLATGIIGSTRYGTRFPMQSSTIGSAMVALTSWKNVTDAKSVSA